MFKPQDRARLENAHNLWLATVRPNHAPHLVPIWLIRHFFHQIFCVL